MSSLELSIQNKHNLGGASEKGLKWSLARDGFKYIDIFLFFL